MGKQTVAHPYNQELLSNKRNKLPIYAITWLNFTCIMIRERNQTQKTINYDFIYTTF